MSASVKVPRSIIMPPVIKDIPAPCSPVLSLIVLSLTAKLSTSITVSVPVTVKFPIVTSLKKVFPVAERKSIPPAAERIGTSPINKVLLETVKSLK